MPLVSVIIPAYNAAATIGRTIASVVAQTETDLEILVIDDGSTDGTPAIARAAGDARVRLLSYEHGGLPAARNRGIAAARGEYLAFIDADDLWARQKLETHVAALEGRPEAGAAYSWSCTIDEDDRVIGTQHAVSWDGDVYARLLSTYFIGNGSNVVLRRQAVDSSGYDVTLTCGEDWEFLARVASRWPFVVVADYHVFYRQHDRAMSADIARMRGGLTHACERIFAGVPAELQPLARVGRANVHVYLARRGLSKTSGPWSVRDAWRDLVTAIILHPPSLLRGATLRLAVRCLIASAVSPRAASLASATYHRLHRRPVTGLNPWA